MKRFAYVNGEAKNNQQAFQQTSANPIPLAIRNLAETSTQEQERRREICARRTLQTKTAERGSVEETKGEGKEKKRKKNQNEKESGVPNVTNRSGHPADIGIYRRFLPN